MDEDDDRENNLVAAGALLAALCLSHEQARLTKLEPVTDEAGQVTNSLLIGFPFLKSPYRVSIERVPDVES